MVISQSLNLAIRNYPLTGMRDITIIHGQFLWAQKNHWSMNYCRRLFLNNNPSTQNEKIHLRQLFQRC